MKTFRFFAALMLSVVCVGLSSCNKDDDEKKDNSSYNKDDDVKNDNSLLVGTWVTNDKFQTLTFNADGTGQIAYDDILEIIIDKFTYTVDSKTMLLTLRWTEPEDGDDPEQSTVIEINGNVLTIGDMVYYKQ